MNKLEKFSHLLNALYGAALDPSGWAGIAPLIAHTFGTSSCSIQIQNRHLGKVDRLSHTANFKPELLEEYRQHFYKCDLWVAGAAARPSGFVYCGEEFVDDASLLGAEIYTDYFRKLDIFYAMGGILPLKLSSRFGSIASCDDDIAIIGVHHARDSVGFDAAAKRELQGLLPHLRRALQMRVRLKALAQERRAALDALECLSVGVLLLNQDCSIVFANSLAEHLIRTAGALTVCQGELRTCDTSRLTQLQNLIRDTAMTGAGGALHAGGVLLLPRPKGRPLSLLVCPMPVESPAAESRPTALVFVGDINEPEQEHPGRILARMYGLTAAETRVVEAILAGHRLHEYADTAGISINTVKTQLKQVFAKTGHSRQTELIREVFGNPILRFPPHLLNSSENARD